MQAEIARLMQDISRRDRELDHLRTLLQYADAQAPSAGTSADCDSAVMAASMPSLTHKVLIQFCATKMPHEHIV